MASSLSQTMDIWMQLKTVQTVMKHVLFLDFHVKMFYFKGWIIVSLLIESKIDEQCFERRSLVVVTDRKSSQRLCQILFDSVDRHLFSNQPFEKLSNEGLAYKSF